MHVDQQQHNLLKAHKQDGATLEAHAVQTTGVWVLEQWIAVLTATQTQQCNTTHRLSKEKITSTTYLPARSVSFIVACSPSA